MHRKVHLPVAVPVTRYATGIGAEPLVSVGVDTDGEHVFVGEPVFAGKGVDQAVVGEVDLVDAERGADPQAVGVFLDGQAANVNRIADLENLGDFGNRNIDRFGGGCLFCLRLGCRLGFCRFFL